MCASSGVRLPFFWLHVRHAVTTFIHESRPPRDMGRMWSQVRRCGVKSSPQKAQTQRSRWKSSRLFSGGTWWKPCRRTLRFTKCHETAKTACLKK